MQKLNLYKDKTAQMENKEKLDQMRMKLMSKAGDVDHKKKHQLEKLHEREQQNLRTLFDSLKMFKKGLSQAREKYEKGIQGFDQCLSQNSKSNQIVSISSIKTYLNQQKALLKQIIQSEQDSNFKSDLPSLVKKRNLQNYLLHLKKQQLQYQVKLLQQCKVGNKVLVYEVDDILDDEDKKLSGKMQLLVEELGRLCMVESIDECDLREQKSRILRELQKQKDRIDRGQKLVQESGQHVKKFQQWIKDFDSLTQSIPTFTKSTKITQYPSTISYCSQTPQISELWAGGEIVVASSTCDKLIRQSLKKLKDRLKSLSI